MLVRRIDTGISSESFLTLPAKHQPRLLLSSLTPSINPLARSLSHVQELVKGECGSATWTVASSTSRAQVPEGIKITAENYTDPTPLQPNAYCNLLHFAIQQQNTPAQPTKRHRLLNTPPQISYNLTLLRSSSPPSDATNVCKSPRQSIHIYRIQMYSTTPSQPHSTTPASCELSTPLMTRHKQLSSAQISDQ